jgi:hypothetical protein
MAAACLLCAACAAQARVGESVKQSETRYGGAGEEQGDAACMILANARNIVYHHGDWVITAAIVNDVTLRIQYEKVATRQSRTRLTKEDVKEILEAEDAEGWTVFNEQTRRPARPTPRKSPATGGEVGFRPTARYRVFSVVVDHPQAVRHEAGPPAAAAGAPGAQPKRGALSGISQCVDQQPERSLVRTRCFWAA